MTILKNAFEISKEELKNSEVVFIPHNHELHHEQTTWRDRFKMWDSLQKKKNLTISEKS